MSEKERPEASEAQISPGSDVLDTRQSDTNPESISYLGVNLPKAERRGSYTPDLEAYSDFIEDDFSCELERKIAISWLNGDPILIEGGTSIGKTTTAKKMAAELGYEVHYINLNGLTDPEALMGRYIPNAHRQSGDEPEYIFADGPVTSGLRQEDGKIKVIVVDEYNSARPEVVIRLHEVLDALERNGRVVLSEDAAEAVEVSHETTKIIALTNPPGRGYLGREPLDPAQLRRWVYQKEATQLPDETFATSAEAMFGLAKADSSTALQEHNYLESRADVMTAEELAQIPGMSEILSRYREFHRAAQKLVASRDIAADQPQTFTFDDRMELRRVRDYIARYYNGDITETMWAALDYYYIGKVESDDDREKLSELVRHVAWRPPSDSRRRDVGTGGEAAGDSPEFAAIIERLDIPGQYERQRNTLWDADILGIDHEGHSMVCIDGVSRTVPSYEEVVERLKANPELLSTKVEQGFTKLLLIPFGLSLDKLAQTYSQALKTQQASPAGLKSSDGTTLELDTNEPIWASDYWQGTDETGQLVYYPKQFTEDGHHGQTKSELITSGQAWQIMLVEELTDIPAPSHGQVLAGRAQLEAGQTPTDYLNTLQAGSAYAHESGLTPEAWLILALTRLHDSGQVLDDWSGNGKASYLFGAYNPSAGYLPNGYWSRDNRQASLYNANPGNDDADNGARSAVRIF